MTKGILLLIGVVGLIGAAVPSQAHDDCFGGRVTDVTGTSLTVRHHETVTFTLDSRTHYTKLITQSPVQADTRLDARALYLGERVYVHPRSDNPSVARWVEITMDVPNEAAYTNCLCVAH